MIPRTPLSLLLVLVAAASGARAASAQTLTGTWQITTEGRRGALTQTLTLTQDGAALTGTLTFTGGGRRGGGGGGGGALGGPVAITDGTVTGNAFSFSMTLEFNGNAFTQRYSGTFEGNSMQGTVEGGRGGAAPFTGTRGG
jgi:hypothetical protein